MNRIRIFRSPEARYYGEDILEGLDIYTEAVLAGIAEHGFTGIWLRVRLRDASRTDVFSELGANAEAYRAALRALAARAAAHGVGVYLYFNEPLCFPANDPFWAAHPDARGASGSSGMDEWDHTFALCTSQPDVQRWLREATADLFRHCPQLAGLFTITASEHHTHCVSHKMGGGTDCPRCAARPVPEVVAEVNNLILEGVRQAGSGARVIAWNWSWTGVAGADSQRQIVERLHPGIAVMADFERGGRKTILGRERVIDEYSLSYVGPSPRFLEMRDLARAGGRELFAKLQIGTTHEIATVNNLPLLPNLLAKARRLRVHDASGILACWNFGNRLTLNTWAFNRFLDDPSLDAKDDATALAEVARDYLGVADPTPVLRAWERFVEAFDHYPFHTCFLYSSPVNYALAYPLPRPDDPDRPMPWNWVPLKKPYGTRLIQTVEHEWGHTGYTLEEYRDAFRAMARLFGDGLADYRRTLEDSPRPAARRELRNAIVIHHILRSTANIYAAYLICRTTPFDAKAWQALADDEVAHLAEVEPLLAGETEIGWHSEAADWFFTQADIAAKRRGLAADGPLAACHRATRRV